MSLLAFGHAGCLEEQIADKLDVLKQMRFCETWQDLIIGIEAGSKAILPSWNSIYGHNFQLYRFLLKFGYKIIDEQVICPKYYLAAKNDNFELVTATHDLLNLTDDYWRKHRSYLLKPAENTLKALQMASDVEQFATICTKAELEKFNLLSQREISHSAVEQKFVIVAKSSPKSTYSSFVAHLFCKDDKFKLERLLYFFAAEKVEVVEVCLLPTVSSLKSGKEVLFFVRDDFRRARVRRVFNQLQDLQWGEVTILGGTVF